MEADEWVLNCRYSLVVSILTPTSMIFLHVLSPLKE